MTCVFPAKENADCSVNSTETKSESSEAAGAPLSYDIVVTILPDNQITAASSGADCDYADNVLMSNPVSIPSTGIELAPVPGKLISHNRRNLCQSLCPYFLC